MFTISCPTCHAKLQVKNENLVGQILACPRCGSMVQILRPDEIPTPPKIFRRFPDVLTSETESGIIGPAPKLQDVQPPEFAEEPISEQPESAPALSPGELRTRKILLSILLGLLLLLIVAAGLLFLRQEPPPVVQEPDIPAEVPVEVPVEDAVLPEPDEPQESKLSKLPDVSVPQPTETENEVESETEQAETPTVPFRKTGDGVADLEKKMPGLIPSSSVFSIDIPVRLDIPVAALKLDQTPLLVFVRTISDLTGVPITLDIDEFRSRNLRIDTPLTATFENVLVGEILTKTAATLGLEPVIADRQILITVPEKQRNEITEQTFDVSDLLGKIEGLEAILRQPFFPDDSAALQLKDGTITVKGTRRKNDEVLRLLEQLRVLRGLPQKTELAGEQLVPEAFGWDAVMEPLTLNDYRPMPLDEILTQIESKTQFRILVDHRALHRALCPLQSIRTQVKSSGGTVNDVLENVLNSIDDVSLTYRIVAHNVLEITTFDTARQTEKMNLEVHHFKLSEEETPEELVRTVRLALEPNTWFVPGKPETVGLGDIVIDLPSQCLFVRQSQPVQRQIRAMKQRK